MGALRNITIAPDATHHLCDGTPLYEARFLWVGMYHDPGLAPVQDHCGGYHIDLQGRPAYAGRHQRTFGFYEGRAAVQTAVGWHHVLPDGRPLYTERYAWCGNYQEGRAPVRRADGAYLHLDPEGGPAYPARHRYAGDFREGVAVIQGADGLHTHIARGGELLHGRWFLDLDVFHKGLARARDQGGWHHVDRAGQAAYGRRFAAVEPFYNGQARVETCDGALEVIDERGVTLVRLRPGPPVSAPSPLAGLSRDMVGFWRTQALLAAVDLAVPDALPATAETVASRIGVPLPHTLRLLRALWELDVVGRGPEELWHNTERGLLLRADAGAGMREAAQVWGRDHYARWQALPAALRAPPAAGSSAQAIFVGRADADLLLQQRMLAGYARVDYARLHSALDWGRHQRVLDAGGGLGTLLWPLLQAHPHLFGVLLELPEVVRQVQIPATLTGRARARGADLFSPWPEAADAIVLARVLHDWPDDAAREILARARESLSPAPHSRIYVLDRVLPEDRPVCGLLDLHMLLVTGGRERTLSEWRALARAAGLCLRESRPFCDAAEILTCDLGSR